MRNTKNTISGRTAPQKTQTPTIAKVSTPVEALTMFRQFYANTDATAYRTPGSKRNYYTISQAVQWFTNQNIRVHGGWLGRALNAQGSKAKIQEVLIDGSRTKVYAV